MSDRVVPQEVFDGVTAAVRAMKKLDSGESIAPGSAEHKALIWAIVKLVDDNLLSHEPLTGKDLEYAQHLIAHIRAGRPACEGCGQVVVGPHACPGKG